MVWLKVEAHGQSLNFLLDSGAGASVLDAAAARRFGAKLGACETVQGTEGRCTAYRVHDLAATVGGTPLPRSILALDLSSVSRACGRRIDGLLGLDFFRGRIVQIDYAAQKVRLFARYETFDLRGETLPLARRNGALCVRVSVNDHASEWMRLDTGCSAALEWVASEAKLRHRGPTSIAASAGLPHSIHTEMKIGNEQFSAVKTGLRDKPMFPGEAGLLGNGLLSHFRVTMDADRSLVLLRRTR
jgi:hypothetical protein